MSKVEFSSGTFKGLALMAIFAVVAFFLASLPFIKSLSLSPLIMGIIIGILGIIGVGVNYPIYRKMRTDSMQKYANDILILARDISEKR